MNIIDSLSGPSLSVYDHILLDHPVISRLIRFNLIATDTILLRCLELLGLNYIDYRPALSIISPFVWCPANEVESSISYFDIIFKDSNRFTRA